MTVRALSVVLVGLSVCTTAGWQPDAAQAQKEERPRLTVNATADFDVTGTGDHAAWRQAEWTPAPRRQPDCYRMDYDGGKRTAWEWAPVGKTFHEFEKFGDLVFAGR
jgi:hypothetical protein